MDVPTKCYVALNIHLWEKIKKKRQNTRRKNNLRKTVSVTKHIAAKTSVPKRSRQNVGDMTASPFKIIRFA